ncbi:MAG: NAD(P)-binding protein, partial [Candidatus Hydrothermarchaeales archaeon]
MEKLGAVAVIGGGITGIQASLDLAESGFKVYLVERSPSIGGRMAQLDKTFPTGDCAMCTMAPKIVELVRHPNVDVLTYSEVRGISGEAGNFVVTVKKNPRYVLEDKCNGCGICADVCPIKVPNEFDKGLGARKAIYIPFSNAVPLVYTLDRQNCILCGKCKIACEIDAIDYDMTVEELEINVGAIIVATGYDLFDPSSLGEYGFGVYKDVVTNLQFERLLSPSGPTAGHVIRPSDGREPKRIAFIQCVGSRDIRHYPYCSQICCMASTKEAIVAREHIPDLKSYILYMDLRAFGKGFQEYVNKAKEEYAVEYLRGRAAHVVEGSNGDLIVNYEDTESGRYRELKVDLVVLAPALKPALGAEELARSLNMEIDEYSFFKGISEDRPLETAKGGIYIAGACQGPRDIPDSVAQASGAASKAEVFLNEARHSLVGRIEELPEKTISEEPRIGVFVCHCGFNIAGVVDVVDVANYANSLPNVIHAEDILYACSADALSKIKNAIADHDLNRVVVASCTPRTHEYLFRKTLNEEGLNPYLFEMANIREQCSWVHSSDPEEATKKAKDLVRMAIARAISLEPLMREKITINPSALVIGGGIAGMTAALDMADQGINVAIVERSAELGGSINELN